MVGAGGAAAATEFGDNCSAEEMTEAGEGVAVFQISAAEDPLPLAAPSAGVITKVKANSSLPLSASIKVKSLRLTGAKTASIVGEAPLTIALGASSADARIPVQQGDRLAMSVAKGTTLPFCKSAAENIFGAFLDPGLGAGSSSPYDEVSAMARFPISAVLEPDADGDGFGDETQDRCPLIATVQAACPPVALDSFSLVQKGKVVVLVTAVAPTPVTVSGKGKAGKAKVKLRKVTKNAESGKFTRFTLSLPKSAKKALRQGRSMKLTLTASATNVVGEVSNDVSKLKVKGGS